MGLIPLSLIAATLIQLVISQNLTSSIKPKRTLSDQIYTHGETKPMVLLWDQASNPQQRQAGNDLHAASSTDLRSFAKPLALVSVQQPIQVFEQDTPKSIAAQQVLYEFQQTPTNAFSNVHVKQLFEPSDITTESSLDPTAHSTQFGGSFTQPSEQARNGFSSNNNNFNQHNNGFNQQHGLNNNHKNYPMASGYISSPAVSESIATPVQHNLFTNHGQNTASFNYFNPSHPQTSQTQHISNNPRPSNNVGKYLYFNGKIVYQPNQVGQFSHNHQKQQSPNLALVQNQQKLNSPMANFLNRYPQFNGGHHASASGARANLTPPLNAPPASYNKFKPPSPQQYQTITKPIPAPPSKKKRVEPEQEEDEQVEEEESDDEERSESQKQEEDEDPEENDDDDTESNDEESEDDDKTSNYEQEYEHDHETDQEDDDEDYDKQYQESKLRAKIKQFEKAENEDDNDDDDDDSSRGASKQHVNYNKKDKHRHKKQKEKSPKEKSPKKFETSENYGYKEKYSTSSKYRSPKKGDKETKHGKPKKHHKKVKSNKKEKPRLEVQEEESKIIPIVHKQKIYKERWYTIDNDKKRNGRDE